MIDVWQGGLLGTHSSLMIRRFDRKALSFIQDAWAGFLVKPDNANCYPPVILCPTLCMPCSTVMCLLPVTHPHSACTLLHLSTQ